MYNFKKLIMTFVYHQVCKKVNCNHTFPFRIPLFAFSENGICMLTPNQQKLYSFSCEAFGTQTHLNFDNIINVHALTYSRKKEEKFMFLNEIKNLKITETQKLIEFRNQTRCKIQKTPD